MNEYYYNRIECGDIVRRVKDGILCYIINAAKESTSIFNDNVSYQAETETGEQYSICTPDHIFELIARKFLPSDLHAYDKIFIWKSRRWITEFAAAYDGKHVWTIGHGRVAFKDVVPHTNITAKLFGSTDRQAAIRFHQYEYSRDFQEHLEEIKREFT